jgi:hypothetical protein
VVWQTAHIMVYFPLHLAENKSDSTMRPPTAFFFTPSARVAVGIGISFTCLTLVLAGLLVRLAAVGYVYLVLVMAAGGYALYRGFVLLRDCRNTGKGIKAFISLSVLRMTISAAILLTVFFNQVGWL